MEPLSKHPPMGDVQPVMYIPHVVEETSVRSREAGQPTGLSVNTDGFWDITTPQVSLEVDNTILAGCKHSAMNAAPGTPHRGHNPFYHALAVDFSPTHFDEPRSDLPTPQKITHEHVQWARFTNVHLSSRRAWHKSNTHVDSNLHEPPAPK